MMKRDLIVFEHERFELTGYDVWMTAGEIASLLGVTIMKVHGIINRMRRQLAVNLDLISKYDLLESGYKDELYNLECVLADKIEVDGQLPTHPVDDAAHLHDGDAEQTGNLARSHPDVVARQLKSFVLKHDEVSLHHSRALHLIYITMPMLGENCWIFASFVASVSISQPNFSCVIFAYT